MEAEVFTDYGQRPQTRNDHADIAARHLGLRPFRRGDIPLALDLAAKAAERTDRGEPIVRALMEGLKQERFIPPSADTLERARLAGRARARNAPAATIVAGFGHAPPIRERACRHLGRAPRATPLPARGVSARAGAGGESGRSTLSRRTDRSRFDGGIEAGTFHSPIG